MHCKKNKGFVSSVMLAVGTISALTIGATGVTSEAFAPNSPIFNSILNQEEIQIVEESPMIDGFSQQERIEKLENYFKSYNMPAADYARAFVTYADQYGIDWTLVATIAYLESTGFQNPCDKVSYSGLGWGSCKINFSSFEESIRVVSMNLAGKNEATKKYYENKTPEEILHTYNPRYVQGISKNYHGNALRIMQEIKEFEAPRALAKN